MADLLLPLAVPFAILLPVALVCLWLETRPGPPVVARACAWCGEAASDRDDALRSEGIPVSHTICPACEVEHFPVEAA